MSGPHREGDSVLRCSLDQKIEEIIFRKYFFDFLKKVLAQKNIVRFLILDSWITRYNTYGFNQESESRAGTGVCFRILRGAGVWNRCVYLSKARLDFVVRMNFRKIFSKHPAISVVAKIGITGITELCLYMTTQRSTIRCGRDSDPV